MGIDVWEVIDAAKTKPFGFQAFYPGPGLGGHCIPIDPFYLTWVARKHGMNTRFIELAGEVNTAMPRYVVEPGGRRAERRTASRSRGSKVAILGMAYKKDVDDPRESPGVRADGAAAAEGGRASATTTRTSPTLPPMRHYPHLRMDEPAADAGVPRGRRTAC